MPGSQAAGNAGITADFSRVNHYNFMTSRIDYDEGSWSTTVATTEATATVSYSLFGHTADWPSLRAREQDHETAKVQIHLTFELRSGAWLVAQTS